MQTRKPHLACNGALAGESYCTVLLKGLPQNKGTQAKTSSKEYDSFDIALAKVLYLQSGMGLEYKVTS